MPSAFMDTSGEENLPREYFEHAHRNTPSNFPEVLNFEEDAYMYWKCPTSWSGFSIVRLWFRGLANDASMPLGLTINAGTCTEAYNIHTQTDNTKTIATTINAYTCLDITAAFATVLAAITPCDLVEIKVVNNDDSSAVYLMGVEIIES